MFERLNCSDPGLVTQSMMADAGLGASATAGHSPLIQPSGELTFDFQRSKTPRKLFTRKRKDKGKKRKQKRNRRRKNKNKKKNKNNT